MYVYLYQCFDGVVTHWYQRGYPPRTIDPFVARFQYLPVARYSTLMGKRIEVTYRAGDVVLPAKGTLAADSGKSIFLEEHYKQSGSMKTFRWEIPYNCILELREVPEGPWTPAAEPAQDQPSAQTARELRSLKLEDDLA